MMQPLYIDDRPETVELLGDPAVKRVGYTHKGSALQGAPISGVYLFVEGPLAEDRMQALIARCTELCKPKPGEVIHVVDAVQSTELFATDWVDGRRPYPWEKKQ